jgi:hypothetical protein
MKTIRVEYHYAECHYGQCREFCVVILNVIILSVIMLSVIMLNDEGGGAFFQHKTGNLKTYVHFLSLPGIFLVSELALNASNGSSTLYHIFFIYKCMLELCTCLTHPKFTTRSQLVLMAVFLVVCDPSTNEL